MSIGKTLLVIEDDTENREAVAKVLRGAGHEVLTAATGRDGLKLLHGGAHPDLILLDFWLPDMTGHAFLEAKARWPGGIHSPVLLVTGDDAWIDEQRDLEQLGVIGLLAKPLEAAELLSAVERDYSAVAPPRISDRPRSIASAASDAELITQASPGVEKQARRFADLLSRASEILAHGSEIELALRELLRQIVPGLADWCVFERIDAGRVSGLACAHENPELEQKLRALLGRDGRVVRGVEDVLRLQRHVIVPGDGVLVVDDWAETGAKAVAARALIERCGGRYCGLSLLVNQLAEDVQTTLEPVAFIVRADDVAAK